MSMQLDSLIASNTVPAYSAKAGKKSKPTESEGKQLSSGWYGLKGAEMTPDVINDVKLLGLRGALDPKTFYKRAGKKRKGEGNEFVQIGTVIGTQQEFYSSRKTRKERKRTLVEEVLADAKAKKHMKKKWGQMLETNNKFNRKSKFKRKQSDVMATKRHVAAKKEARKNKF